MNFIKRCINECKIAYYNFILLRNEAEWEQCSANGDDKGMHECLLTYNKYIEKKHKILEKMK